MKITSTLHNHSTLCDGVSTLREMADAAVALGFDDLGFSGHSPEPRDPSYSLKDEGEYVRSVAALRREYAGRLRIWCGIEREYGAHLENPAAFDYFIGSVHIIPNAKAGRTVFADSSPEEFEEDIRKGFSGDTLLFAEEYYRLVGDMAESDLPDIIAHFDLLTKNNENGRFFDENDSRYREAALEALERCAKTGGIFEINTGAIARGYRTAPYPSRFLLERILELKAPVTLSADCHDASKLEFGLNDAAELARDVGFCTVRMWENGKFVERAL